MNVVWFWTFWHWSKESFREGSLLRSPLHGIGSHWDEWFRHEASESDLRAIEETGRSEASQRQFLVWFFRNWAGEIMERRMAPLFVLSQLAPLPPFNKWPALARYRAGYSVGGISAIVLAEQSQGQAEDVRLVEAVILPSDRSGQKIASEGFVAEVAHLETTRTAAKGLLRGNGLLRLLAMWVMGGARPYSGWLKGVLFTGWATVAGLIIFLIVGPEPDGRLFGICAALAGLWGCLVLFAVTSAINQIVNAWRTGREMSELLETSQVRLRMNGGLTLQGGSAGLPFALNIVRALCQAQPRAVGHSWIWQRLFRETRSHAGSWAATGSVTQNGAIKAVVLEPKLRASLGHDRIRRILTPLQRDANREAIERLASTSAPAARKATQTVPGGAGLQLGFAAESPSLRISRCRHIAQAIMALGRFADSRQVAVNIFAVVVSTVMLIALPDLRSILFPHRAPAAIAPASLSPYELWISLDTKHPQYFHAVLESDYWSNRRAEVKRYGGVTPSVRAQIPFHRLTGITSANENQGYVWIERRQRFLMREYNPGERVGRYSIPYLTRLGHE